MAEKLDYKVNDIVVYPTHGVGKITGLESQKYGEVEFKLYVVAFEKDKMILRIPVNRAKVSGLRGVSSNDQLKKMSQTLKGKAKTSRGMWSRRAKEYETKINSGDIVSIAEVVRDLHKNIDDPDRSYSERVIYESALDRLAGEVAAVRKIDLKSAAEHLVKELKKVA